MHNLIHDPDYLGIVGDLRARLFERLGNRQGERTIPYTEKFSTGAVMRHKDRSKAAEFPDEWLRSGDENDLRNFMTPDAVRAKQNK